MTMYYFALAGKNSFTHYRRRRIAWHSPEHYVFKSGKYLKYITRQNVGEPRGRGNGVLWCCRSYGQDEFLPSKDQSQSHKPFLFVIHVEDSRACCSWWLQWLCVVWSGLGLPDFASHQKCKFEFWRTTFEDSNQRVTLAQNITNDDERRRSGRGKQNRQEEEEPAFNFRLCVCPQGEGFRLQRIPARSLATRRKLKLSVESDFSLPAFCGFSKALIWDDERWLGKKSWG